MARGAGKGVMVRGVRLERRRFTGWAALYFIGFLGLPFLALCLLFDLALYALFTGWLDRCYALLCLLDRTGHQ